MARDSINKTGDNNITDITTVTDFSRSGTTSLCVIMGAGFGYELIRVFSDILVAFLFWYLPLTSE